MTPYRAQVAAWWAVAGPMADAREEYDRRATGPARFTRRGSDYRRFAAGYIRRWRRLSTGHHYYLLSTPDLERRLRRTVQTRRADAVVIEQWGEPMLSLLPAIAGLYGAHARRRLHPGRRPT
jgi:hypothetical protein